MDSWLTHILSFIVGAIITIVALALVRGNWSKKEDIVDVDPEIEEAERQWKEQSKGY
jgi:uncharacterized membrane-anchored protein YhcB (DUF1043 family)